MAVFKHDLTVGLICTVVGAGLGVLSTWSFTRGDAEKYMKMYEQANLLNEQTSVQNVKIVEQTDVLKKGFSDLISAVNADENINQNLSVTINNLQNNVDIIRNIASSTPIDTSSQNPNEVKIPVGNYAAVYMDSKSTVALKKDETDGREIYVIVNGYTRHLTVGEYHKYRNDKNIQCKLTYMGIQNSSYVFSIATIK